MTLNKILYYNPRPVELVPAYEYYLPKDVGWFKWTWKKLIKYGLVTEHKHRSEMGVEYKRITLDYDSLFDMCREHLIQYERGGGKARRRKSAENNSRETTAKEIV